MNKKLVMRKYGILYSDVLENTAHVDGIKQAIGQMQQDFSCACTVSALCADRPFNEQLKDVDILINVLGAYYPEEFWHELLDFYMEGGCIINIGAKPFTKPYTVKDGELHVSEETNSALHSLVVADDWIATGPVGNRHKVKAVSPAFAFVQEMADAKKLPEIMESYSAYYHLAEFAVKERGAHDSDAYIDSALERGCEVYDESGRVCAVPIVKICHFNRGSLLFLNFTTADKDYFDSENGIDLMAGVLRAASGKFVLKAAPEFARYFENETPNVRVELKRLPSKADFSDLDLKITLELADMESGAVIGTFESEKITFTDGHFVWNITPENMGEGFYSVKAVLSVNGMDFAENINGFYKYSQQKMMDIVGDFEPVEVNTDICGDFCVRGGKPFAMHGTNYHTTDVYRSCFNEPNPYQTDIDLTLLRQAGFNILRTGNWQDFLKFYENDGQIKENSLRALEAFFLTAARHDLPVQFVLGAFVMNPWDHAQCPIHNPEAREKTIRAFASFAGRLNGWKNVQIDAINEPSYSLNGTWRLARPSGDPYEKKHWTEWLRSKYHNNICELHQTWGSGSEKIRAFEDAPLPQKFERRYDTRGEQYEIAGNVTDFYIFARNSFSAWVGDIRSAVKQAAPDMIFMMGRDESLRVPSQQYESYRGHVDMINWHQWHFDTSIFGEYFFNRVRGLPCCGQEMGVYHYISPQGSQRLSEQDCANILERKLLYSFGNWIQWQAFSDPNLVELSEICLGLFRADRTESAHMGVTRLLSWIEEKTAGWNYGRNEDAVKVLMVYPTSYYFSLDRDVAFKALYNASNALHYHLKMQADLVLEQVLRDDNEAQIGNPELIIFPAAALMEDTAWEKLLKFANDGKVVLLSGFMDMNEYWKTANRLKKLDVSCRMRNLYAVEKMTIDEEPVVQNFYNMTNMMTPGNIASRLVFDGADANGVYVLPYGKGKILMSPVPMELGDDVKSTAELYRFALKEAGLKNPFFELEDGEHKTGIMIYPIEYKDHIVYTIVNEGDTDTLKLKDIKTGADFEVTVDAQRGCKLWLDKRGNLAAAYIHNKLRVNEMVIEPQGDMALFYGNDKKYEIKKGESL